MNTTSNLVEKVHETLSGLGVATTLPKAAQVARQLAGEYKQKNGIEWYNGDHQPITDLSEYISAVMEQGGVLVLDRELMRKVGGYGQRPDTMYQLQESQAFKQD